MRMENARKVEEKVIEFLGGRPERETVINDEDITNLKIALETSKTFEQFLRLV